MRLGSPIAAVVAICAAAAPACTTRDDLSGERREIPGLGDRGSEHEVPVSDNHQVVYDFVDNRAAAVVYTAGGLVVDCGTADMAKYVDGGYRSPWHLGAEDGSLRVALINGLAGELYIPIGDGEAGIERGDDGAVSIRFRARAVKKRQLVSVFLNENKLGDVSMPTTEWETYSIDANASAVADGENKLRFYFRYADDIDGKRSAGAIERIIIGSKTAPIKDGVMTGRPVTRDGQRLDAISVSRAARLSYFIHIPDERPELVFAAGGAAKTMSIRITQPGGGASDVWSEPATKAWVDHRVDVGEFAGKVVRVDLISDGPADWGKPQLVVQSSPVIRAPATKRVADHIIVWTVASLRDDRVDGPAVSTPGFSRLAERGLRFRNAITAGPAPGPAHVAMLTGRYPAGSRMPETGDTVAERLREAGYATALISGNGFVNDEAGFARGFDLYVNPMRRRHPFAARILWQRARRVIRANIDGQSFIYMATVEPHLPYTPSGDAIAGEWEDRGPMQIAPAETAGLSESVAKGTRQLKPDERRYIEALYDAEVRDVDSAFADMLRDLEELRVLDRTAIILVGDHGEEVWDRGNFGHGRTLYQEVLDIPLIVAGPGIEAGTVDMDVDSVDVYTTALDLAGIAPGTGNQGESVVALAREAPTSPRPVFSHLPNVGRSMRLGRYKLIVQMRGGYRLYDLVSDPEEKRNLVGTRPLVERYMRNVFGIAVAYEKVWSRDRWGSPHNVTSAFAADHGL
jgi:arylsulfatase A-like enzyme